MSREGQHPAEGWAASYGRVSLYRPHLNQHTPENHERLIREAARSRGLQIRPGYEFYDYGYSGSTAVRRPGYEKAVQAVIHKEVEALIVPTVDRLSRRGSWHIGELFDAVEAAQGVPRLFGTRRSENYRRAGRTGARRVRDDVLAC